MKPKRIPSKQITTTIPMPDHRAVMAEVKRLGTNKAVWLRGKIAEWVRGEKGA